MDGISFLNVLIAVLSLIVIALPAFILVKTKILPVSAASILSTLVLYCCSPANILMAFQKTAYNTTIALNMLIVFGLSVAVFLVIIFIVCMVLRKKSEQAKSRVTKFAAVFPNCAYMGIPFLQMLFSDPAVQGQVIIYAAVIISVFHTFSWTFGVYAMSGDRRNVSIKKIVTNPCVISVVLGFLLFIILKQPLTDIAAVGSTWDNALTSLSNSINFIGDTVTPLGMFVIGMKLANVNLKQLFLDKWAYLGVVLRQVVSSLVAILIVAFLPVDQIVKYTIFFLFSMPSATSTAMFAIRFEADGDFASVSVLLSTVLSVITIPLMFLLFQVII